jgi:hypothetical protein
MHSSVSVENVYCGDRGIPNRYERYTAGSHHYFASDWPNALLYAAGGLENPPSAYTTDGQRLVLRPGSQALEKSRRSTVTLERNPAFRSYAGLSASAMGFPGISVQVFGCSGPQNGFSILQLRWN